MTLGEKLSPILIEIQDTLLDNYGTQPQFTEDALIAAVYIFQTALMDKMWDLQQKEDMSMDIQCAMAEQCGKEIRQIIKTYANIDMHEVFKNKTTTK